MNSKKEFGPKSKKQKTDYEKVTSAINVRWANHKKIQ